MLTVSAGQAVSESKARTLVERVVGLFDDGAWDYWMEEVSEQTFFTTEQLAEHIIQKVEGSRLNMPRPRTKETKRPDASAKQITSIEPPSWWAAQSAEAIEQCRDRQARALELFGLNAPVSAEEADEIIGRELRIQTQDGVPSAFEYAHLNPSLDRVRMLVTPAIAYTGNTLPAQKLHSFALLAKGVVRLTGCEMHEATSFLLTNRQFAQPWIRVETERFGGVITLHVGNATVPAKEVHRAYRTAVKQMKSEQPEVVVPRRRRPGGRTSAVIAFVLENHADPGSRVNWPKLLETWNSENPGWKYPSAKAMSESHRRALARASQRGSNASDHQP